jgi:hypothetical protein
MIVVLGWGFQVVQDDATTVAKTNKPQLFSRRAWAQPLYLFLFFRFWCHTHRIIVSVTSDSFLINIILNKQCNYLTHKV